jgi:hypothetical protein
MYSFLSSMTEKLRAMITEITGSFVQAIDDEEMLRKLVFENDFEGRDSLVLISYYEIDEIMNNKNMEKVALELWSSEYDVKGSIMECSSAWKILNSSFSN